MDQPIWEYWIVNVHGGYHRDQMQTLNEAGERGWELCGVVSSERVVAFYFKRRKQEGS